MMELRPHCRLLTSKVWPNSSARSPVSSRRDKSSLLLREQRMHSVARSGEKSMATTCTAMMEPAHPSGCSLGVAFFFTFRSTASSSRAEHAGPLLTNVPATEIVLSTKPRQWLVF